MARPSSTEVLIYFHTEVKKAIRSTNLSSYIVYLCVRARLRDFTNIIFCLFILLFFNSICFSFCIIFLLSAFPICPWYQPFYYTLRYFVLMLINEYSLFPPNFSRKGRREGGG